MTYGREIVVGLVIILSALGAALGTLWLKGRNFGEIVLPVDALVAEVGQLRDGNEVKLLGVTVGRVIVIEVEPDGQLVRISMSVQDVRLPADAVVVVAPESLFGDWQVEIVSRSRFPNYAYADFDVDSRMIAEVPVLRGYTLPALSRLTATAEAVSVNLATLTDRFAEAFSDTTAENLRLVIENLQLVSEDVKNLIQQQASTFEDLSAEVSATATELNRAAQVARSTLEGADRLLASGDIDTLFLNLAGASRDLDAIADDIGSATSGLGATLVRVDSTFARVDRMSARIESGEGALGRLLGDTALVARAEDVLAGLDALLTDFRENPNRYVRLSIF